MNPQLLAILLTWVRGRRKWISLAFLLAFAAFSTHGLVLSLLCRAVSPAIGLPVKVSRIHFKFAPFEVGVYGVKLGNPPGFESRLLASIPELFVQMEPFEILKGKIHIRQLRFHLEEITVERNAKGQINLQEAGKRKPSAAAPSKPVPDQPPPPPKPAPKPAPAKKGMQLQIDEVIFSLGRARYVESGKPSGGAERLVSLNIQNLVLKNVTDPSSLMQQILTITLEKIAAMAVGVQFDNLRKSVEQTAQQTVASAIQAVSDWAKQFR